MLSIIAAVARNGVIGKENDLPWRLPADFMYFKRMTLGKPCVMARKTFESLGGALKNRPNIVLTRDQSYEAGGAIVVHSIEEALEVAEAHRGEGDEMMILGGATLYEAMIPWVDRMYITLVHEEFQGDTYFPEFNRNQWVEVWREDHEPDKKNKYPYSFTLLERKLGRES